MSDLLTRTLTSMEVATMVGKRHADLMKDIRLYCEYLAEGKVPPGDFFVESTYKDGNNQTRPCFNITKKGCELVGNKMVGAKGVQFTALYVSKFNQMEQYVKSQTVVQYQIPTKLSEALRLAADLEEQNEQLQLANAEMKPKALFADAVSTSDTSILVGALAKIIKQNGVDIGATRLFDWLRTNGYLIKRKGSDWNMPTQKSMDLKLFEIKETVISRSDGTSSISKTAKVTGKGQQYFVNKFLNAELESA